MQWGIHQYYFKCDRLHKCLTLRAIMSRFPTFARTVATIWITHRILEFWAVAWWWTVKTIKLGWTICNKHVDNNTFVKQKKAFLHNKNFHHYRHLILSISDLKMKPSSQLSPVFPTTRLQSHIPVTWSQVALFWHVHLYLHPSPYFPCSQAAIMKFCFFYCYCFTKHGLYN